MLEPGAHAELVRQVFHSCHYVYRGFTIFWIQAVMRWGFAGQATPLYRSYGTAAHLREARERIDLEISSRNTAVPRI